jgi:hypothetical protein
MTARSPLTPTLSRKGRGGAASPLPLSLSPCGRGRDPARSAGRVRGTYQEKPESQL